MRSFFWLAPNLHHDPPSTIGVENRTGSIDSLFSLSLTSDIDGRPGDERMQRIGSSSLALALAFAAGVCCVEPLPTRAAVLASSRSPCLSKDVRNDDAISACTIALKKNPKDAKFLIQRGAAWSDMGDYDYAIGDFSRAIGLAPKNALAYFYRAFAREKKGDFEESLADFKRYRELNPSDLEAQEAVERLSAALAPKPPPTEEASDAQTEPAGQLAIAEREQPKESVAELTPERPSELAAESAAPLRPRESADPRRQASRSGKSNIPLLMMTLFFVASASTARRS
jgi:tetratricopeptide (TPR) repeat protein